MLNFEFGLMRTNYLGELNSLKMMKQVVRASSNRMQKLWPMVVDDMLSCGNGHKFSDLQALVSYEA